MLSFVVAKAHTSEPARGRGTRGIHWEDSKAKLLWSQGCVLLTALTCGNACAGGQPGSSLPDVLLGPHYAGMVDLVPPRWSLSPFLSWRWG